MDSARISLGLAAVLGAAPFLLPEHRPPILSFYDEWLGLALAAAAVLAFALDRHRLQERPLPEWSLWLLAFAGWLGVQSLLREPAYAQLPLAGILYVLFAAQLAWLGRALALRFGAAAVVDVLAACILAAAGLNAAIAMLQFYGLAAAVPGVGHNAGQITGHVGQRNLLADFLAWGVASLLYLQLRGRLGAGALCAALLVLGSAYTQSRSALLFSAWLALLTLLLAREGAPWRRTSVKAGLIFLSTMAAMLALPLVHELLGLQRGQFALDRMVDAEGLRVEARPAAWALALRLFVAQPWLGVGWGEFAGAAFEAGLPPQLAAQTSVWSSPHNLPLHVLAEAGLPGAALLLLGAARWWLQAWRSLRRHPEPAQCWAVAGVGIACLHALLEYPLWYAHFLCLAALASGIATAGSLEVRATPVRRTLLAGNAFVFALLLWALADYWRFDQAYLAATGHTLAPEHARATALAELRAVSDGPLGAQARPWRFGWAPAGGEAPPTIAEGERALRRSPRPLVIARQAESLARAGERQRAERLLDHAARQLPDGPQQLERARLSLR